MPAIRKSLELYEMRRQCRGDIRLALYRVYRVIFAAHNEGRTLDAMKIREHIERLAQWSTSETLYTQTWLLSVRRIIRQYPSLDFWHHVSFNHPPRTSEIT